MDESGDCEKMTSYQSLLRSLEILDQQVDDLSMMLDLLGVPKVDHYSNESSSSSKESIVEKRKYPKWFETSLRSKNLPNCSEMADDYDERTAKFAAEWDAARFGILREAKIVLRKVKIGEIKQGGRVWHIHSEIPLEISHETSKSVLLFHSATHVDVPSQIMDKVDHCKVHPSPFEELGSNRYFIFTHFMQMIFELKSIVNDFANDKELYDQVQSLAAEVVYWLENNVGYGKYVGKFRVTEFAENILQEIEDLAFGGYKRLSTVKEIEHDIDHLGFRISTYFGFFYETIKEVMEREDSKRFDDLQYYEEYDTEYSYESFSS